MFRILCVILAGGLLLSLPADAASKKTKNAAAVGAGVGLVTGGVSGAAKGAVVGGGAGAYANADKGDKAKKKAKQGAAIGAGVGLVTDGVSGAAKGAVYGGATGAMGLLHGSLSEYLIIFGSAVGSIRDEMRQAVTGPEPLAALSAVAERIERASVAAEKRKPEG